MDRCPRCSHELKLAPFEGASALSCAHCGGRAVTLPVLRRLRDPSFVYALWDGARRADAPEGLVCPSCRRATRTVEVLGRDVMLALDVCTCCHLVFFDAGEIEAAPQRAKEATAPPPKAMSPDAAMALVDFEFEHHQVMKESHRARFHDPEEVPDASWKYVPALLGMPVEFDTDVTARRAYATWSLLAAIAVVTLLTLGDILTAAGEWGFIPAERFRHGGLTYVTCFFLHASWMHLVGNLYFLWVFGNNVENHIGPVRLLVLVLLATVFGCFTHDFLTSDPTIPVIGSSGGISGVLVFYACAFPKARIGLLVFIFFVPRWVRVPAVMYLVFWVLLQVAGLSLGVEGVSYGGHLGGALVGLLWWIAWQSRKPARRIRPGRRATRQAP